MTRSLCLVVAALLAVVGCEGSGKSRTEQALADLQRRREQEAKEKADAERQRKKAEAGETVALDPPYRDADATVIAADGPCPEGLWALFDDEPPGATKEEKQANLAKRPALAEGLRGKKFLVKLRGPPQVMLKDYDAAQGRFPVIALGTVDCTDSKGRIALAWTDPKAVDPGASAINPMAEVSQNVWMAPPIEYFVDIKSQLDAKAFQDKNRVGLSARVVFTVGKAAIDRKLKRIGKVSDKTAGEEVKFGGGVEDWGAGRLLRVDLVGIRVAAEREAKQLFEHKGAPPRTR